MGAASSASGAQKQALGAVCTAPPHAGVDQLLPDGSWVVACEGPPGCCGGVETWPGQCTITSNPHDGTFIGQGQDSDGPYRMFGKVTAPGALAWIEVKGNEAPHLASLTSVFDLCTQVSQMLGTGHNCVALVACSGKINQSGGGQYVINGRWNAVNMGGNLALNRV
mmetsp:Transcript_12119/g.28942  ORF Transcript_12119/g.28942 Transcript_12119/m.28942 type:complete len:166 (-) Transcript_12119:174-671(-)